MKQHSFVHSEVQQLCHSVVQPLTMLFNRRCGRDESTDEWSPYEILLRELYLDKKMSVKDIMIFMHQHQFVKRQQYERVFRKWGLRKNHSKQEYQDIDKELKRKQLDLDEAHVRLGAETFDKKRLRRANARHVPLQLADKWGIKLEPTATEKRSMGMITKRDQPPEIIVRPALLPKYKLSSVLKTPWQDFVVSLHQSVVFLQSDNAAASRKFFELVLDSTLVPPHHISQSKNASHGAREAFMSSLCDITPSVAQAQPSELDITQIQESNTLVMSEISVDTEASLQEPFNCVTFQPLVKPNENKAVLSGFVTLQVLLFKMSNNLDWHNCHELFSGRLQELGTDVLLHIATRSPLYMTRVIEQHLLLLACESLDIDLLCRLMELQVDANLLLPSKSPQPQTALQHLCTDYETLHSWGRGTTGIGFKFFKHLLQFKADPNVNEPRSVQTSFNNKSKCSKGYIFCPSTVLPLFLVNSSELDEVLIIHVVKSLLEADAHVCEWMSTIDFVLAGVSCEVLTLLLDAGLRVNCAAGNTDYSSALHAAVASHDSQIADFLLSHGAQTDVADWCPSGQADEPHDCNSFRSPLAGTFTFDQDLASNLITLGANPNGCYHHSHMKGAKSNQSRTYSDSAKHRPCSNIKFISNALLSTHMHMEYYRTPLQGAAISGCARSVEMILDAGASISCCHGIPPLVLAARLGNNEIVKLLIQEGVDINASSLPDDIRDWVLSPLAEASATGNTAIMKALLHAGADVNYCDFEKGFTPLQAAIICRERCSIDLLLEAGADIGHPGSAEGMGALTAALLAVEYDDGESYQQMMDRIVSMDIVPMKLTQQLLIAGLTTGNENASHFSLTMGANMFTSEVIKSIAKSMTVFEYYLKLVPDLSITIAGELLIDQLFLIAAEYKSFDVATAILHRNESISVTTLNRWLLSWLLNDDLHEKRREFGILEAVMATKTWGIDYGTTGCLETFLLHIVKVVFGSKKSNRFSYDRCYHPGICKPLTRFIHGFPAASSHKINHMSRVLNQAVCNSGSELQEADLQAVVEMIRLLLVKGACVNPKGPEITTPLQNLQYNSRLSKELVTLLLTHGAEINSEQYALQCRRDHPLAQAIRSEDFDTAYDLLRLGADVNAPVYAFCRGRTPLQSACEVGHLDLTTILLNRGANVNAPPAEIAGLTALQAAAIKGHIKIVQILLGAGADVAAPASTERGRTAINGAAEWGRLDILKLLLDAYNGDEPIRRVRRRAKRFALREGRVAVVELLETYLDLTDHSSDDPEQSYDSERSEDSDECEILDINDSDEYDDEYDDDDGLEFIVESDDFNEFD